ncbi:hypothetical protein AALP_AAs50523U000100, partial [Arabis alpina]
MVTSREVVTKLSSDKAKTRAAKTLCIEFWILDGLKLLKEKDQLPSRKTQLSLSFTRFLMV